MRFTKNHLILESAFLYCLKRIYKLNSNIIHNITKKLVIKNEKNIFNQSCFNHFTFF